MGTVDQDVASLYGFSTYVEMCCIVKAVFILVIYNASKNMCCPFVSDIGILNGLNIQISKPTSRGLLAMGETRLYGFPTYHQGTVCQRTTCLYGL